MIRKQYSEDFKREAVRMALSGEKTKVQVARDLGVAKSKIYVWIAKFGPDAPTNEIATDNPEIIKLRKALARAEMERDILKKAIGIFSETQR